MVKPKILVISNDSELAKFLKEGLFENNYQLIYTKYTGEGLREVLYQEYPELVVVDVMMPALDGIEISLRVRQWSQIPIIMLSAWEAGQNNVRLFDLSAENYLSEPLNINEVIALVEYTLRNTRTVTAKQLPQDSGRALSPGQYGAKGNKTLKIVCAWCDRYMGERDGYGVTGVTHSICEQCSAELEKDTKNRISNTRSPI